MLDGALNCKKLTVCEDEKFPRCVNTLGSYSCEEPICDDAECPPFSRCVGDKCECEVGTLDTSKLLTNHPTILDKCLSNTMQQIEWMNWYRKCWTLQKKINSALRFLISTVL